MYGLGLITLSLAAVAKALPAPVPAAVPVELQERATIADKYKFYTGSGNVKTWPNMDMWGSFDQLWNANVPLMRQSCVWNGWGANNSEDEINNIKNAINSVSSSTGVDKRFILTIMMQESKGCVRVRTTNNGVVNPGLMQSHNGAGTCVGKNPCPAATITQMIKDGTAGTSSGDGLKQCLDKTSAKIGGKGGQAYYAAARMYNSGSVDYDNLNNGFTARKCYATDIANRFTGWTLAATQCYLDG